MYTKLSKTIADVEKLCLDLIYFSSSFYKLLVALIAEVLKIPHVNNSLKILDAIARAIYQRGRSDTTFDEITENDSIDKVHLKAIKTVYDSLVIHNTSFLYEDYSIHDKECACSDAVREALDYRNIEFEQLSDDEKIESLMALKNKLIYNTVIPVLNSYSSETICSEIKYNPKSLLLRNKDLLDYCANRPDTSFENILGVLYDAKQEVQNPTRLYGLMFAKYEKMNATNAPIDNGHILEILVGFIILFLNDKYDGTDNHPHLLRKGSIITDKHSDLLRKGYTMPDKFMVAANLICLADRYKSTIAQMLNRCPRIILVIACILENCDMIHDPMNYNYHITKSLYDSLEELLRVASKLRQTSKSPNDDIYWSDMILEIPSDHIPNLMRELGFINNKILAMECKPISSTIARYESITGEIFPDSWRLFLLIIDDDTDSFLLG